MKILIYTFKNFPYKEKINFSDDEIFIFDKIKSDLEVFNSKIEKIKPSLILGIAKSTKCFSTIEEITINKFNKGKVDKNYNIERFKLYIPKNIPFIVRKTPTSTFCNYTMFKINQFLLENNLKTKFIFIHINENDLESLKNLDLS